VFSPKQKKPSDSTRLEPTGPYKKPAGGPADPGFSTCASVGVSSVCALKPGPPEWISAGGQRAGVDVRKWSKSTRVRGPGASAA
jgi:hypothetical protein